MFAVNSYKYRLTVETHLWIDFYVGQHACQFPQPLTLSTPLVTFPSRFSTFSKHLTGKGLIIICDLLVVVLFAVFLAIILIPPSIILNYLMVMTVDSYIMEQMQSKQQMWGRYQAVFTAETILWWLLFTTHAYHACHPAYVHWGSGTTWYNALS